VRLSKKQEKEREELVRRLAEAGKLVDYRFSELLSKLKAAPEDLNEAIRNYNLVLLEAGSFVQAIGEDFRAAFDEKSERWQEGEAGQEAESFISEWESFEGSNIPEVAIIDPELEEKPCHAKALEDLPNESQ
jgi:hypothetical protein